MDCRLMWIIAGLGALTLAGIFWKMKEGFGPFNLRAFGITLVATFAALLALRDASALTSAIGILGAIAGYLFGLKDS
jgi:hypothetical protein